MNLQPTFNRLLRTCADWFDVSPFAVENAFWTILVGAVVSTCCAIVGCYLVLRRMSLLGDAISHAILAGIGVAFLLTGSVSFVPMFLGAMATGLLTAFLTQSLHEHAGVSEDSSMGVVFTSLFALGVIIVSQVKMHLDTTCVLFGSYEAVALEADRIWGIYVPTALKSLSVVLALTLICVGMFWKELKLVSFDPLLASAMGFSAVLVHYLLMGMVAAVTVASLEAVGAIVVIAMLIVPAVTAHLLTERLWTMMLVAVVVGILCAFGGYLLALRWETNAAGMMAVVGGGQLLLAVLLSPRHGVVSRSWHNLLLGLRIVSEDIVARLYRAEERGRPAPDAPTATTVHDCRTLAGGGFLPWLAIPWLRRRGQLLVTAGGAVQLTDAGRENGQRIVRAHRLWESFLDEHFDLPPDHLHEPAERIEHFLGPELQQQIDRELSRPDIDPHGSEIPASRQTADPNAN